MVVCRVCVFVCVWCVVCVCVCCVCVCVCVCVMCVCMYVCMLVVVCVCVYVCRGGAVIAAHTHTTGACVVGRFACPRPADARVSLPSSRVDDGVCDCCDGADEAGRSCADTCTEQEHRAREAGERAAVDLAEGRRRHAECVRARARAIRVCISGVGCDT